MPIPINIDRTVPIPGLDYDEPGVRKAIQIIEGLDAIWSLCDDGSVWILSRHYGRDDKWIRIVDIPID